MMVVAAATMMVVVAATTVAAATRFRVIGDETRHSHDGNQHTQKSFHFYQPSYGTGW
jgi:hypothetical protein